MNDLEKLQAIEDIKHLKALYFLHLDEQNWQGWIDDVFTPDMEFLAPETKPEPFVGLNTLLDFVKVMMAGKQSVHHGHMPIITFKSETEATGVWAMEDRIYGVEANAPVERYPIMHGFGHYHDTYVKLDGSWRISASRLTRLRLEVKSVIGQPGGA